jgi:hypothetical protein
MTSIVFKLTNDNYEIFNRADSYVCKQHGYDDYDDIDNVTAKQLWESTFDVVVELDEDPRLEEPQFGNIVFNSEESYTMFLLRFGA